ncbi:MAG: hypothetical protein R3D61_02420 [Defluviimonas denitrificans]
MDPELLSLIELSAGLSAVDYKRLEFERTRYWHDFAAVLGGADAFICPTCAKTAPLATDTDDMHDKTLPDGCYGGPDMTSPFNLLAPCPAISLPLPVGPECPSGCNWWVIPIGTTGLSLARDLERAFAG